MITASKAPKQSRGIAGDISAIVAIESRPHFSQSKVKFEFIPGLLLLERPAVHADQQIFNLENGPYLWQSKTELLAQRTPTLDEEAVKPVTVKLPCIRRRRNHSLLPFDEEDGTHFSQSKTDVVESFDEMIWDDDGVELERIIHVRLSFAGYTRSLFSARDNTLLEGWSNNINISTPIIPMENSPTLSVDSECRNEDRRPLTAYERLGPKGRWNEEHYVGTGESLTYGTSFIKSMTKVS